MEFIIISGMSGAGKSSAAAFLEDLGFYCVDNLPVALIPSFAGICLAGAGTGKYSRVALVTDIRGGQTFDGLFAALRALDRPEVKRIFARCPHGGGVAYAVGNRLKKAAGFCIINAEEETL